MFMNLSFQIVPVFKKSRARSSRLGTGHQKKGAQAFLGLLVHARETDTVELTVLKEVRGAMNEYQDSGPSSGAAGGTHAAEITVPPFSMSGAAPAPAAKKEYTVVEKTACSIEAMRNAGECEACQ
jgi:hypothetical protein